MEEIVHKKGKKRPLIETAQVFTKKIILQNVRKKYIWNSKHNISMFLL